MAKNVGAKLEGVHRGIVVSVDDPDRRNRYRVYVHGLHTFKSNRFEFAFNGDGGIVNQRIDSDSFLTQGTPEFHDLRDAAETIALADPRAFNAYPWAEISGGGFQSGMHPSYRVGDKVWVMFERCDPGMPVIMGGSADVTDVPAYKAQDDFPELDGLLRDDGESPSGSSGAAGSSFTEHELRSRKWSIRGRIGGSVIVSESHDEAWVKLSSGGASLIFSQSSDSLHVDARGIFSARVGDFDVQSNKSHFIARSSFVVEARGQAGAVGATEGIIALYGDYEMDLFAHTSVAIGQYADRLNVYSTNDCHPADAYTCGISSPQPAQQARDIVRQSRMVWMGPKLLQIGIGCPQEMYRRGHYLRRPTDSAGDRQSAFGMYRPTISTRVESTHELVIWVNGHWQPDDTCDPVTGASAQAASGGASGGSKSPKGPVGFMMLRATGPNSRYGEVDLTCESDGTLSIIDKKDGTIVLWADSKIVINAPEVVIRTTAGTQTF